MDKDKFYVGKVIYNEDPTFTGRCKIRVFGLFDSLGDDFIPWFTPVASNIFSTKGGGSLSVPKIGDVVRVKFANNDLYSGEYSSLQYLDPDMINEIKDDYLGTQVLLFDAEAELLVLYQNSTGFKIYHKGSSMIIDPKGMIQLKHQNNNCVLELKEDGIIITTAGDGGNSSTGNIKISSGNTINIVADNVNVTAKTCNIGNNAQKKHHPAVKGDALQAALSKLATAINTKYPMGYTVPTSYGNILSKSVNVGD